MALPKLLSLLSGVITMVNPVTISAGASSANAVVALNASGQVDITMIPSFSKPLIMTSTASAALATSGTIGITNPITVVAPSSSVTGVILTSGSTDGQLQIVINNSANTITFAAVATSHVADGISDVIPANAARIFVWNATAARWFRAG